MNTQELVDKPIRKPSSNSDSRRDDLDYPPSADFTRQPLVIDDLLGKKPRDTMTIDDHGRKLIDDEVLKERIGANMKTIKDFFKTGAEFRPFQGMEMSNEFPDKNKVPGVRENLQQPGAQGNEYDIQQDGLNGKTNVMVKQITDNITNLLNEIVTGIKAQHVAPISNQSNFFNTNKQQILPPRDSLKLHPESNRSLKQDTHSEQFQSEDNLKKGRLNLDNYYQTLSNYYAGRNQQPPPAYSLPLPQQNIPVRPPQQLADYLQHLDSNRQTRNPDPRLSTSEGELKEAFGGPLISPRSVADRDKSEGELSDIGQRIFLDN